MTLSAEGGRPPRRSLLQKLAAISDGAIIRTAFFILLAGTACVLYVDYRELTVADTSGAILPNMPVLPAFNPTDPAGNTGPTVTTDAAVLEGPLTIELAPGGVLNAHGTIDIGAFERFAAEIAARGDYVKTVDLDSPGGSVADAMAMGQLIRDKGFDTQVQAGALCASSCPLVFAGGEARMAFEQSAIGVHQIYANADPKQAGLIQKSPEMAMSDAQSMTATISRYLGDMGMDSKLWLHALETPPSGLYYFSPQELLDLKLATVVN